jgi:tetratricopeptide (TPR) repeat protein
MFWFLQRRVRGEGYYVAKAGNIVIDTDFPCINHPYDKYVLPETFVSKKQNAEAISIYKDDLRKDPEFVQSIYQLACIAKEQHQLDEAIQYAEDALRIDPHHIQSLIFLSWLFLEQDDLQRAEQLIRLANLKQPGNADVQKLVGQYENIISKAESNSISKSKPAGNKPKKMVSGLTSIVIRVSTDTGFVNKCLQSIRKHTQEPYEIIFIVHGTSPLTVKWAEEIARENKNCRYIVNADDIGIERENNQGIYEAIGEFILLLNENVVVTENWLSGFFESMKGIADKGRDKSYIFKVS